MADYELWITDDAGRRVSLMKEETFFAYSRAVSGLGTLEFGTRFDTFRKKFNPYFQPDWRLEIWRSPGYGVPMRRENIYLLRKPNIYNRQSDNVQIIRFYGRDGIDLLKRRCVIQRGGTSWASKTDYADDMMKAIVREQMVYGSALDEDGVVDNTRAFPNGEFTVEGDVSLGPTITMSFADRPVFEILRDIKAATFQKNVESSSNHRIFFSVDLSTIAVTGRNAPSPRLGWIFRTKADLYGTDRTNNLEFSLENENIREPNYSLSHLDEINAVYIRGNGSGLSQIVQLVESTDRINASRWNRSERVITASSESDNNGLQSAGNAELDKWKPKEEFPVTFLNIPGNQNAPRSLYGLDWDLGDRLRVNYAGKQFEVDVTIIYVSVDDQGKETITGRNELPTA